MSVQTAANTRLAAPRSLLDRYLRETAEAMAQQRIELGRRIAEARKGKRWKQKELAAAVHVEPTTVSRWENGRHAPDLDVLDQIARATDRPLSFFIDPPPHNGGSPLGSDDEALVRHQEIVSRLDAIDSQLRRIAAVTGADVR